MSSLYKDVAAAIIRQLDPRHWASAFTGVLAQCRGDRTDLFSYFQGIIEAYSLRHAPMQLHDLSLTREDLVPKEDYDEVDGALSGYTYIPTRCQWNGAGVSNDPTAIRQLLSVRANDDRVADLLAALVEFANTEAEDESSDGIVKCAVHPYGDCVFIPAILYAVRDLLPSTVSIQFEPVDWVDLPGRVKVVTDDITYCSSGLVDSKYYHHLDIKRKPSRMAALRLVGMPLAQRDTHTRAPNFNGYYSASTGHGAGAEMIWLQKVQWPVPASAWKSNNDNEAKQILALATGLFPSEYVIATIQGVLWAADCGLIHKSFRNLLPNTDISLGTLEVKEVAVADKGHVVCAVRRKGEAGAGIRLKDALYAISADWAARFRSLIDRSTAEKHCDRVSKDLLSMLKAPVVEACGYDRGMLARISPSLMLESANSKGKNFEREVEYRPEWWDALEASCRSEAIAAPNLEVSE